MPCKPWGSGGDGKSSIVDGSLIGSPYFKKVSLVDFGGLKIKKSYLFLLLAIHSFGGPEATLEATPPRPLLTALLKSNLCTIFCS